MMSEAEDLLRDDEDETAQVREQSSGWSSVLVVLILGFGTLISCIAAGRAQCQVTWTITIPCLDASSLLVNQIKEWETESCPPNSPKCMYSLVAVVGDDIIASHATPALRLVSDITFNFSSTDADSCEIQGRSTSRSWYAMLDSGTNYIYLHNLVKGSGLSSSPSFTEFTSDHLCTRYSSSRLKLDV